MRQACLLSAAEEMVATLPEGYETVLGREFEGGTDLSGGQWQSLAIARAYLRDADILALDEPTSALDALAELAVYRQFADLSAGKTVLLISHRLGSARLADRIVFLEGGRIVEDGSHDDLMRQGGRYAGMFAVQAGWYA
ncbi:MAG: ATP-binding cassette domain-containing protein [bacterium]|nr:ATP-binding cassette domain-containing protein [bacterium]